MVDPPSLNHSPGNLKESIQLALIDHIRCYCPNYQFLLCIGSKIGGLADESFGRLCFVGVRINCRQREI
jgi:hypothetical protein